jgi:hypothetical protein
MQRNHLLDQIFWHALTGPHARYASGAGAARRYARGFSPILAFADPRQPDFSALAPYCEAGEHFYCEGRRGARRLAHRGRVDHVPDGMECCAAERR